MRHGRNIKRTQPVGCLLENRGVLVRKNPQPNTGDHNHCPGLLNAPDDRLEIALGILKRHTAQEIVAAEEHHNQPRIPAEHRAGKPFERHRRGIAAHAGINDRHAQCAREHGGIIFTAARSNALGETVSEANNRLSRRV